MLCPHDVDIIALQETHLILEQEYAFKVHASTFDFFFSHGTSQSAGVLIAIKHNSVISP